MPLRRLRILLLALALPLCLPPSPLWAGRAAPIIDGKTLDPDHTSTTFWVRHIMAPVAGRFDKTSGAIDIPRAAPNTGKIDFTVKTASVDTGSAVRDDFLRAPAFFDTVAYPTMTFVSDRIAPAGKGVYRVTGRLTIKDVTKTVTIPVKSRGGTPHPLMPCVDVTDYQARFSLNRLDYHVGPGKFAVLGVVGDTVDIRMAGEVLSRRPGCVQPPAKNSSQEAKRRL